MGGFLKWWYPTTMGFPTKKGSFWGVLGVPPFKETPHITWNVPASMNQCTGRNGRSAQLGSAGNTSHFGWNWLHSCPNKQESMQTQDIEQFEYQYTKRLPSSFCPWKWQLLTIFAVSRPSMSFQHPSIPGLRVVPAMVGHLWDGGTHLKSSSISALGHVTVWMPLNNHWKNNRTHFFRTSCSNIMIFPMCRYHVYRHIIPYIPYTQTTLLQWVNKQVKPQVLKQGSFWSKK